jgi:hypothetical protein
VGYRLPVPPAPAFCLGNVIVTRLDAEGVRGAGVLLGHEARHATQFACCGGVVMLPLYFLAAGVSWLLTGDFGARNIFERRAGLAEGGYADRPLRAVFARLTGRKTSQELECQAAIGDWGDLSRWDQAIASS